jgi:small multidrug resistance pump
MHWLILSAAIVFETIGTTALKASEQFTRPWPSALAVLAYGASFFLLSVTLKVLPVGVVYAIWSGAGIVLIATLAWLLFGQRLDLPAVIGMALIVAGIVVINLFSKAGLH